MTINERQKPTFLLLHNNMKPTRKWKTVKGKKNRTKGRKRNHPKRRTKSLGQKDAMVKSLRAQSQKLLECARRFGEIREDIDDRHFGRDPSECTRMMSHAIYAFPGEIKHPKVLKFTDPFWIYRFKYYPDTDRTEHVRTDPRSLSYEAINRIVGARETHPKSPFPEFVARDDTPQEILRTAKLRSAQIKATLKNATSAVHQYSLKTSYDNRDRATLALLECLVKDVDQGTKGIREIQPLRPEYFSFHVWS